MKKITSRSLTQTEDIASSLLDSVRPFFKDRPVVFLFQGDLGSGKTFFVKSLAKQLGIEQVISPTFVISYEYESDDKDIKHLYHLDLYRIADQSEFPYLGIEDVLTKNSLVCIEWSENGGEYLERILKEKEACVVNIGIEYLGENKRKLRISNS